MTRRLEKRLKRKEKNKTKKAALRRASAFGTQEEKNWPFFLLCRNLSLVPALCLFFSTNFQPMRCNGAWRAPQHRLGRHCCFADGIFRFCFRERKKKHWTPRKRAKESERARLLQLVFGDEIRQFLSMSAFFFFASLSLSFSHSHRFCLSPASNAACMTQGTRSKRECERNCQNKTGREEPFFSSFFFFFRSPPPSALFVFFFPSPTASSPPPPPPPKKKP